MCNSPPWTSAWAPSCVASPRCPAPAASPPPPCGPIRAESELVSTNHSSPGVPPPPLPLEVHAAPFLLIHGSSSGRHLEGGNRNWLVLDILLLGIFDNGELIPSFCGYFCNIVIIVIWCEFCSDDCLVVRRSVSALQTLTSCCKCKKLLMTKLPDKDKWWQWDRIIFCIVYGGSKLWTKQTPP